MQLFFTLLAIVFVPFIWFVVRVLRYTDETIGVNSPLYRERTYQITAWQYFGKFYKIALACLLLEMIWIVCVLTNIAINNGLISLGWQELSVWVFIPCFLVTAGFIAFYFSVDWEYWTATREVSVTLNPYNSSILICTSTEPSFITPDSVIRIEHHLRKSNNSRDPLASYGYYEFYQADGRIIRINNIFFIHVEFIERFFTNVPQSVVLHRLPRIIKDAYSYSA